MSKAKAAMTRQRHPAQFLTAASQICDSEPVLGTFAACEWAELSEDGKLWAAALVQETTARLFEEMERAEEMVENFTQDSPAAGEDDTGWEWARLEVYGHRQHYGRVREEEKFGGKMLRIDIPTKGDPALGYVTLFYGNAAIFSLAYTDEATVMKANKPREPVGMLMYSNVDSADDEADF